MYVECEWCGKTVYRRKVDKRYSGVYCSQACITARDVSNYKIRFMQQNKNYRLISYIDKNNVTIACKRCGNVVNTDSTNAIRRCKCYNCIAEKNELIRTYKAQVKEEKKINKELASQLEKLSTGIEKLYEAIQNKEEAKENGIAQRKLNELIRQGRLINKSRIDKGISLNRVYKKDNGICYLCGGICDYNDQIKNSKGYYITGKNYPTIDHVIPLRKGGTHTWDNVRLAHMGCNINRKDPRPLP